MAWNPKYLSFLLSVVFAGGLAAQSTTGSLLGRVESGGEPVAHALVAVTGPQLPAGRQVATNEDGVFLVAYLPPGIYEVRIRAIGYRAVHVQETAVRLGRVTEVPVIALEPAALEIAPITVTAEDLHADLTGTVVGGHLTERDYAELPSARDYRAIIELLPLANQSFYPQDHTSVLGASGYENTFYVDGVNLTDPQLGGPGTATLPSNFVRAIDLEQAGLDARVGGTTGGLTNAVTYSGGEHFDGNVFGFATSNGFQGAPRTPPGQIAPQSFVDYDAGLRLGGPVSSHRLWYSAAWNPQVERTVYGISGFGTSPDQLLRHLFASKLTWQAGPRLLMEGSLLGERSTEDVVSTGVLASGLAPQSLSPLLEARRSNWTAGALRLAIQPWGGAEIEARVSRVGFSNRLGARDAAGAGPQFQDYVAGTVSGGTEGWDTTTSQRSAAALQTVFTAGAHRATLGGEYQETSSRSIGGYSFLFHQSANLWIVDSLAGQGTRLAIRAPALYAQDYWKLSRRLTLGGGLRWSRQSVIREGRTVETLTDEWQPHISFSLRLGDAGKRVFGSWGIVYQQQPLNMWGFIFGELIYPQRYFSGDPRTGATQDSLHDFGHSGAPTGPSKPGLSSENYVESLLGYETDLAPSLHLTARAIHRALRGTVGYGFFTTDSIRWGTPGAGDLSFLPKATRVYDAVEFTTTWNRSGGTWLSVSYILSRLHGNYIGFYDERGLPQTGELGVQLPVQAPNSSGDLPSDRRHVVKVLMVRPVTDRVTLGAYGAWMSGTPLNEFGAVPGVFRYTFLVPRGSAGRLPAVTDLNLRLTWQLPLTRRRATILADAQHLLSRRTEVVRDQLKFFDLAGTQSNPDFGHALSYAPPMQVRVGVTFGLGADGEDLR